MTREHDPRSAAAIHDADGVAVGVGPDFAGECADIFTPDLLNRLFVT